jgi:DNA-directed RNA polymerase specialized sigma24 family protein
LPVDDQVLEQARNGDRDAVEAVITECFPAVHRVAHALTGDPLVASQVVRFILRRGVSVMPRWRAGLVAENWFYHNTLLTIRRLKAPPPPTQQDLLITAGPSTDRAYVAFVRAMRGLPIQQIEAFVLNHCEHLNERLLGVAMDLSTGAASSHLAAGTIALRTIAGDDFPALTAALERAYSSLTPPDTIIRTAASNEVRSYFWQKLIRRVVRRLIYLAILGAAGYGAWYYRDQLIHWFEMARAAATTQRS